MTSLKEEQPLENLKLLHWDLGEPTSVGLAGDILLCLIGKADLLICMGLQLQRSDRGQGQMTLHHIC